MDLIVPLSDVTKDITPTKITLQYTEENAYLTSSRVLGIILFFERPIALSEFFPIRISPELSV